MSPESRRRSVTPIRRRPAWVAVASSVLAVVLLAGCAGSSFDPSGPCNQDGKVPGAYPDLEALVPTAYEGRKPDQLDSGRTCSGDGLGTLATHGVKELRFAGATWSTGTQSGLTLATFTDPSGPGLQAPWLAEFYEATASAGTKVNSVEASDVPIRGGTTGKRIDVLNDESYQTVVVWEDDGRVVAVLVADFIREIQSKEAHETVVQTAVDTVLGIKPAG